MLASLSNKADSMTKTPHAFLQYPKQHLKLQVCKSFKQTDTLCNFSIRKSVFLKKTERQVQKERKY